MALDAIIAYKHDLVRGKTAHIEKLRSSVVKSDRSLLEALRHRSAFICEIKPSSPSLGIIRKDADITAIADIYAPFARAISVLADEKFFGGSLENVQRVSERVSCPVLAKDVVVSPLQIIEARAYGAHAVLLMLSVLDDDAFSACARMARELAMDFITEVHDESELARANKFGAPIIGINNRNLKTLAIDMSTTERLAPLVHKNAVVIAESGIYERAQIKKLAPFVQGFLIGTALMKAPRIDLALRELLFGRVKICGLTNKDDADLAFRAGAYYGGLNFARASKRVVGKDEAQAIMRDNGLVFGGVFVNQSIDEVSSIAADLKLAFVQLHGDENSDYLVDLKKRLPACTELWRAVRMKNAVLPRASTADRIVLDGFVDGSYGGTGTTFDWSILHHAPEKHFILAGGITPQNVAVADSYAPFALDIASGVEEDGAPRKKSASLIKELFLQLEPLGS